jgi:hypothetical protein
MKNLYEPPTLAEVHERMAQLTPDSERQWGRMNSAQMLAHCARAMEMATGDVVIPRMFLGRLIGPLVTRMMIRAGKPMKRNAPTDASMYVSDDRDFAAERDRLRAVVDRFADGGPERCTKHPHFFFGALTPHEWAALMYQHLDHHLRQFQA